jgi:CheY-like chemotaxis protein
VDGHDGRQALVMAETCQPNLVLLDIGLSGMDGYEVARRMQAEPWIGETTLVALTGYGGEEDRQQALAAGFDHHMVKPVDLDTLHGLLALTRGGSAPSVAFSITPMVG